MPHRYKINEKDGAPETCLNKPIRIQQVGKNCAVLTLAGKAPSHDPDLTGTLVSGSTVFHCDELYFL